MSTEKDRDESTVEEGGELFLLIENPHKGNSLGPILRCAAAFAVRTLVTVGYSKCSVEGSHGASKYVEIIAFPALDQATSSLRNECRCGTLIGLLGGAPVESSASGVAVDESVTPGVVQITRQTSHTNRTKYPCSLDVSRAKPFSRGNCCLVLSKSWRGLPLSLARCCDLFVHVPHEYVAARDKGDPGAELLDTQTCLSIALHHFSAARDERAFRGQKFEKSPPLLADRQPTVKERQKEKKAVSQDPEVALDGSMGDMFGGSLDADY